jgi:hypothetical protein
VVDIEAILDHQVSDTTLRARRDEWIDAGVFEQVRTEALGAFDPIIGLDLDDVAVDGSLHKALSGGEGTGPNPTDRAKLGWKWSVAAERHGIPIGWAINGATATTSPCSSPPSMLSAKPACSPRPVSCTSTAATTHPRCGTGCVPPASTSSRSNAAAPRLDPLHPKHGSWLQHGRDRAECARRAVPDRRLADQATLEREVAAWQAARNAASRGVNWRFTTADARIKLKHLYPAIQG